VFQACFKPVSDAQHLLASSALADPDGAFIRIAETWVRYGIDTPKSEAGVRTIALGQRLASELFEHRGRSKFDGDDERVFCSPLRGTPIDHTRNAETFRAALTKAGVEDYVRPFHDLRHWSITNAAAAGTPPAALMARAGHSDFKSTQGLHRPRGRDVPRGGRSARKAALGRFQYKNRYKKYRFVA
jgi:integrase